MATEPPLSDDELAAVADALKDKHQLYTKRDVIAAAAATGSLGVLAKLGIDTSQAAHGTGNIGEAGDPLDTAYVTSISGDGDTVDISPGATGNLNGIQVEADWSSLKTTVEAAGRGDYITVEQGDNAVLTPDATISVPDYVVVDLGAVELTPGSTAPDLWDVGKGAQVHTGHVLPADNFSNDIFLFDGSANAYREWHETRVYGRVDIGTATGNIIHMVQNGTNDRVVNVESYVTAHGGNNGVLIESQNSGGWINGNRFYGTFHNQSTLVNLADDTGDLHGNTFYAMLQPAADTAVAIDARGEFNRFVGLIWDLGQASTTGIRFNSTATRNWVDTAHSSVTISNITAGGTDNRVFNRQSGTLILDTNGSLNRLFEGITGEEAAGTGNAPTQAEWPNGVVVVNTDDSTVWVNSPTVGFIQLA